MPPAKDLTGLRFGQRTVIRVVFVDGQRRLLCRCDCGSEATMTAGCLNNGKHPNCGCVRRAAIAAPVHQAEVRRRLETRYSWRNMIKRCTDPRNNAYARYGGRGIRVCQRWMTIANFVEDMGLRSSGMTLDRVNNNENYEPGNCRWATPAEQAQNRRSTTLNAVSAVLARALRSRGQRAADIAHAFGCSLSNLQSVWSGHTWTNALDAIQGITPCR